MTTGRLDHATFLDPPRDFSVLPFWFLNGELDPDEMRFQLGQLREKGVHGVILHGRFGLEMPYMGDRYLERIALAADEAKKLGLATWIYDEMNWPSGTSDKRVPKQRPDLAERYVECLGFNITGPWFMCLTGGDSRYLDFERSTPVAAFAIGESGHVIDLTPNLSFENVIPWEVPPGDWQLMYMVEKRADYYIDALDPGSTAEFLRLGYAPYADSLGAPLGDHIEGFYSDEPAMHYFVSAGDNAIVPWTKDMFRRFHERNGYDLRPKMPDLFYDLGKASARVRYDFYTTLTELYSEAYYAQIRSWCKERGVRFTAHLLYEEWLRRMIRVEGNLFRHYENMDVVAVDHLYPVIGTRDAPDQHVALKVASSAAHHVGSEQVICESFGGIFMDATMQRMKWITDWECVLGVNVINPHGFHYTLEGARKRDWPPSMFYQYPWWPYYSGFSRYVSRVCSMLTGGRHVANLALLWPINSMFATYVPQEHNENGDRIEGDFNILTDALLRLHRDFDILDERIFQRAQIADGRVLIEDESYEAILLPPTTHCELATVDQLDRFVSSGGSVLSIGLSPSTAFDEAGLVDVSERMTTLMKTNRDSGGSKGRTSFLEVPPLDTLDREVAIASVGAAIDQLLDADIRIDDPDVFCLHRRKDGRDIFFVTNPTFEAREISVSLPGNVDMELWDPSTGEARPLPASSRTSGRIASSLRLPPTGSVFIVESERVEATEPAPAEREVASTVLDEGWELELLDDNALVLKSWRARLEEDGSEPEAYASPDAGGDEGWFEVGPGGLGMQVPGGIAGGFPAAAWYRIPFEVVDLPSSAALIVDGFVGERYDIFVDGVRLRADGKRSAIDSQMKTLDITNHISIGQNVISVRLVLRGSSDGIADLVKIVGGFSLAAAEAGYVIVKPRTHVVAGPWTEQGYPFLSGRARYKTTFAWDGPIPERLVLDLAMTDDVVEIAMNGRPAGTCMWPPYSVDVTGLVADGDNVLELTVANTLANLLSGVERSSGLSGPPRLVSFRNHEGS
jgi:hypothetical protein